ncbi:MAG: bifunctional nuclease family protein [Planctomycetes bacterium]|nr:bifunctional nuclease family protein [Planctomycetota bacterium]
MVEMELSRIVISETSDEQVIVLQEVNGTRTFPIVIGNYEAMALDRKIKNIKSPRPLTHDLIENIFMTLQIKLLKVTVTQLKNSTFYAKLTLQQNGKELEVDARPSDALVLATHSKIPIYVSEEVLDKLSDGV